MLTKKKFEELKKNYLDLYNKEIQDLENLSNTYLNKIDELDFELFTATNPYIGETKNKIFLTYNDHYYANDGTNMSINSLHHPHKMMDDRGYIKGVAVDLYTFLELKKIDNIRHYFNDRINIYQINNLDTDKYNLKIVEILDTINIDLDIIVSKIKEKLNKKLREKTNCSLLFYLRDI